MVFLWLNYQRVFPIHHFPLVAIMEDPLSSWLATGVLSQGDGNGKAPVPLGGLAPWRKDVENGEKMGMWLCVKTNSTPVVHIKIAGLKWMWISP